MRPRAERALGVLFVAFAATWVGCNTILGNGYGVDPGDPDGSTPGEAGGGDGDVGDEGNVPGDDGGPTSDGDVGEDGTTGNDGGIPDATSDVITDSGPCPTGVCPTLLTAAPGALHIAVSAASVFWTTLTTIQKVSLAGTAPMSLTLLAAQVRGVAVTPSGVPYVSMPTSTNDVASCTPDLVMRTKDFLGSNSGEARPVAADSANVFVGIYDDGLGMGNGTLFRLPLDGSTSIVLNPQDTVVAIELDSTAAAVPYWLTPNALHYGAYSSTTGIQPSIPVIGTPVAIAIALVGKRLFVATAQSQIYTCPLAAGGGCTVPLVSYYTTKSPIVAIAANDTSVYWAEGTGASGMVSKCNATLCTTPVVIATGQLNPNDIAVDGTTVYWSNFGTGTGTGGTIMKNPK